MLQVWNILLALALLLVDSILRWTDARRFAIAEAQRDGKLTHGRVLETAVGDGLEKLRLEQEVAERGAVHTGVRALRVGCASCGAVLLSIAIGSGRGGVSGLKLLVGVVDEIFLGGHVG
jgi:hypothetical protein